MLTIVGFFGIYGATLFTIFVKISRTKTKLFLNEKTSRDFQFKEPTPNCSGSSLMAIQDFSEIKMRVYPNPAKDFINVESAKNETLQLYNNLGQLLIVAQTNEEGNATINTTALPAGTYVLVSGNLQKVVLIQ